MTGDLCRSILAQANATMGHWAGPWAGPHYVKFEEGTFYLYPFGTNADYRYSCRVDPVFSPGRTSPPQEWIFNVLWMGRE